MKRNKGIKRIVIDQEDFQKLTKGEIVEKDGVKIVLSDIGWHTMMEIISANWTTYASTDNEPI